MQDIDTSAVANRDLLARPSSCMPIFSRTRAEPVFGSTSAP